MRDLSPIIFEHFALKERKKETVLSNFDVAYTVSPFWMDVDL
jgi:hypothetical protein